MAGIGVPVDDITFAGLICYHEIIRLPESSSVS